MRYIGGKHRIARHLATAILPYRNGRRLIEPFCGGLSATVTLQPDIASDINEPLIKLIEAIRDGWIPPSEVSEETYLSSKGGGDALEAFCGFCCSFGGKWFGGYAREGNRNFALQGKNALLRKVEATKNVHFLNKSYDQINLNYRDVIYCDPPYKNTTNGYQLNRFDTEEFWDWCLWANKTYEALIFISEFEGPEGISIHSEFNSVTDLRKSEKQQTVEKLFRIGDLN